jgi:hypothetical protein
LDAGATQVTIPDLITGPRLVVDLSNKSAQLLDSEGRTTLIWSGVTRRTAVDAATAAGWYVSQDWMLTSPPDGFWCPVLEPELCVFTDEEACACFEDHGGMPA